ncbi:MAG: FMN-binding protein [Solobacterium sp.]|nr:FMN-binding protein [Solobacterium sp.]
MKKESTLYKVLLLGVLCAICGTLLAGVNAVTAPIIEAAAIENEKANLELIYPGATFKEVKDFTDESGLIQGVYEAEGKGMIYKIKNTGYNSNGFTFLIAFNNDGTVGGYTALEHGETSGFGSRAFEGDYVEQIKGLTSSDPVPLLTGATITTTAVQQGIDAAKALFNEANNISYDPNAVAEAAPAPKGDPLPLNSDYAEFKCEVEELSNDGTTAKYHVTSRGFGLLDPDGMASHSGHEYKRNEAEIEVDLASMTITNYTLTVFGDTEGIGDTATTEEKQQEFVGKTLDDSIDSVTGATWTGKSLAAMAQAALNAASGN